MQQSSKPKIKPRISISYDPKNQEHCQCFRLFMTFDKETEIYNDTLQTVAINEDSINQGYAMSLHFYFPRKKADTNKIFNCISIIIPTNYDKHTRSGLSCSLVSAATIMETIYKSKYELDFESINDQIWHYIIDEEQFNQWDQNLRTNLLSNKDKYRGDTQYIESITQNGITKDAIKQNACEVIKDIKFMSRIFSASENDDNIDRFFPDMDANIESLIKKSSNEELKEKIDDKAKQNFKSFFIKAVLEETKYWHATAILDETKYYDETAVLELYPLIDDFFRKLNIDKSHGKDFSVEFVRLLNIANLKMQRQKPLSVNSQITINTKSKDEGVAPFDCCAPQPSGM